MASSSSLRGCGPPSIEVWSRHDFDSFRVFVWSTRRHRYETAYIERNVKGFLPVIAGPVPAPSEQTPGFSIVVEKKDGLRYRRNFALLENRVRFSGEERIETTPGKTEPVPDPTLVASEKLVTQAQDSLYGSLKERIRRLFGR
jgi:hypothetical protein